MTNHLEQAQWYITQDDPSLATAHAVLALIDIITGDRETEIQEANDRIEDLESMLSGCREALRQRENAEANSTKQET